MKTLFTAEALSKGARSGTIQSCDGLLDVTVGNPLQKEIENRDRDPDRLRGERLDTASLVNRRNSKVSS